DVGPALQGLFGGLDLLHRQQRVPDVATELVVGLRDRGDHEALPVVLAHEAPVEVVVVPPGRDRQDDRPGTHAGLDDGLPHRPGGVADLLGVGVLHVADRVIDDRHAQTAAGHGALDAARDDAAALRAVDGPVGDAAATRHRGAFVVLPL